MSPSKSQQQQKQQPPPQQKTQGKDKDDLQTSQANEAKHQPDGVEEVNQDSTEPSQELTIAFFKADKIPQESKEEMGSYEDVVHNLFEPMLPEHLTLKILPYDVVNARAYPTEAELANIDAIVISGSFEDEAHEDTVMILRLAGFLIGIRDNWPRIRIIGICFGLQILARAFGPAKITENDKGWEVGSTKVDLTEMGKRIFWAEHTDDKVEDLKDHVMMQQIHSSIVTSCPSEFTLLGHSEITPVQSFALFYPEDTQADGSSSADPSSDVHKDDKPAPKRAATTEDVNGDGKGDGAVPAFTHSEASKLPEEPWRRVHMLGMQGHPEWDHDILVPLIDGYENDGTFTPEFADEARKRARAEHDGKRLGKIILRCLGVV